MKNIDLRNTLNINKYVSVLHRTMSEWKIIIPLLICFAGVFLGTFLLKRDASLYEKLSKVIETYFLYDSNEVVYISFFVNLLIPTCFAIFMFFVGLSVYGGIIVNVIPLTYCVIVGALTYYLYAEYTLKGLAYCVIMIFPYAVLSIFSFILISAECISMSHYLLCMLSNKKRKTPDYSINKYYINTIRSYIFIIIAAVVKTGVERLFSGLFIF